MTLGNNGLHCRHYALQTKMVLSATAVCLFGGTLLFYLFEHNRLFAGMSFGEQLLNSFFCTVTPRTAGFNAVDNGALSESSKFLSIVFMFIGGAPGSTAGGVKVTTHICSIVIRTFHLNPYYRNKYFRTQTGRICYHQISRRPYVPVDAGTQRHTGNYCYFRLSSH